MDVQTKAVIWIEPMQLQIAAISRMSKIVFTAILECSYTKS